MQKTTGKLTAAALGLLMTGTAMAQRSRAPEPLTTQRVASGLTFPDFATFAPGDTTRLFIIEKQGRIRVLNLKTDVLQTAAGAFLNIDSLVGGGTSTNAETGLLGLAFHPDYQKNGYFYVNYTNNSFDTVIARYSVMENNRDSADSTSALTLMTIDQPQTNHNGGWIGFGPLDDYLYIATGDGGNACDTGSGHSSGGNAQDILSNLLGKILRIDVNGDDFPADAGRNYAIPATNPFVGVNGDDEIWLYGLRNPYRNSHDRMTGDLWIGDVGQDTREEVNVLLAGSPGGVNFGWPCREGFTTPSNCSPTGCTGAYTNPLVDYSHPSPPPPAGFVCAVTGGYAYRGCAIPSLAGTYFFADFCGNAIWSLDNTSDNTLQNRTSELANAFGVNQIVSFGEDARGEMYIVDQGDGGTTGQVFRIIPVTPTIAPEDIDCNGVVDVFDLLQLLAEWGCAGCASDFDGDDTVNLFDLLALLAAWG